jgi:hypothetical protein
MFDQLNSRDSYRIVIGRAMQPAAAAPRTTSTVEAAPAPTTTEGQSPPTDTTAAGATTQSPGNVVGQTFDDECVVAWPTAPRRLSTLSSAAEKCTSLRSRKVRHCSEVEVVAAGQAESRSDGA